MTEYDAWKLQYPPSYDEDAEDEVEDGMVRVMFFRVGKPGEVMRVRGDDDFASLITDGFIDTFTIIPTEHGGRLKGMCDDEGYAKKLPLNWDRAGSPILGDFLVFRCNAGGETESITDDDVKALKRWIR